MDYTIVLHDSTTDGEEGYAATCVEFPEANGQGKTEAQCIESIRSAIQEVIAYRRDEAQKSLAQGERFEMVEA